MHADVVMERREKNGNVVYVNTCAVTFTADTLMQIAAEMEQAGELSVFVDGVPLRVQMPDMLLASEETFVARLTLAAQPGVGLVIKAESLCFHVGVD